MTESEELSRRPRGPFAPNPEVRRDVWRIRRAFVTVTSHRWYVGFVRGEIGAPAVSRDLGLVAEENGQPPGLALQFGREQDARQFREAFLKGEPSDYVYEGPTTPPAWSESEPDESLRP